MSTQTDTAIPLSPADLEALIRRVVREELGRILKTPLRALVDDWEHEGPDDPGGDDVLLAEALAVLQEHGGSEDAWMTWGEFETGLPVIGALRTRSTTNCGESGYCASDAK